MLSNKAKYGLKALSYLARRPPSEAIQIAEVAERQGIPRKFLDLILLDLRNAGFVRSKKGRGGGYFLAETPDKIFVGPVIRVLDGPLAPIPCASRTAYQPCTDCISVEGCGIRGLMVEVRDAMADILDHTTLEALAAREVFDEEPMYHI